MVRLNVFVSSRFGELKDERASIKDVLPERDFKVYLFEKDAGARSESTRQVYTEEVKNCDIYIGIFKKEYSHPTEEEYKVASINNKDILIYLDSTVTDHENKLRELLGKIDKKYTRNKYSDIECLKKKVHNDVYELLKRKFKRSPSPSNIDLLKHNIRLVTEETEFKPGDKDCWKIGYFDEGDIKSDFDARRPITNMIMNSLRDNPGTILFGRSHYGKSMILQRIMIEEIENNMACVIIEELGSRASLLKELVINLTFNYEKILVIVDNADRSGSEEVFKLFNDLSEDEQKVIHFLFVAKKEQFEIYKEGLSFSNSSEVEKALRKVKVINLSFDTSDALYFLRKGLQVSNIRYKSEEDPIRLANSLYKFSQGDPFMFVYAIVDLVSRNRAQLEATPTNFILRDIKGRKSSFGDNEQLSLSVLCSFINMLGINISTEIITNCGFNADSVRALLSKGFLFKNSHYKTRHELWSAEYIKYLVESDFDNDLKLFDSRYKVTNQFLSIIESIDLNFYIMLSINTHKFCKILGLNLWENLL